MKNEITKIEKKVFVFIREIENIETKAIQNSELGSRFIEMNKEKIDEQVAGMRSKLKSRVAEKIGTHNMKIFKVRFICRI